MDKLIIILKILFIIGSILLMSAPLLFEFLTFRRDVEKKISYKRFRVVLYTAIFIIGVSVALILAEDFIKWVESLQFIQWLSSKISIPGRVDYCVTLLAAITINVGIGVLYVFFSKFVRIGLKNFDVVKPAKKDGEYTLVQKIERKVIDYFCTPTWELVGNVLKFLAPVLSAVYALIFVVYELPALFGASWLPYDFINMLFKAGWIIPILTLLGLWEAYFFLSGLSRIHDECPDYFKQDVELKKPEIDIKKIEAEVKKQYEGYFSCNVDLSKVLQDEYDSTFYSDATKAIGASIENDARNPQINKKSYLDTLDKLMTSEKSLVIAGSFFSEFSMYFFRYLSVVAAEGENIIIVCNTDPEIDEVYNYVKTGLSEIVSLYNKGATREKVDFDDPIWKIVKVYGEKENLDESAVDNSTILVTSLSFLCSAEFERDHPDFLKLTGTMVCIDILTTFNAYSRQLSMFNSRLEHITRTNAIFAKNADKNEKFAVRYMSKPVRYVCFDNNNMAGLDRVLENLLAPIKFESADSMHYNPQTLVRCYNFESRLNDEGRRDVNQVVRTKEELSVILNVALTCRALGAGTVTIFADGIPYMGLRESLDANSGKYPYKVDPTVLRINDPIYNPDKYSVVIALDSGNNLPATIRKYTSMVSDKPSLVIVFSKPYMLRDYFTGNIDESWLIQQYEMIPVANTSELDVAQQILVKANAGGISEEEILTRVTGIPYFEKAVAEGNINAILSDIMGLYGMSKYDRLRLYDFFEYTTSHEFNEFGKYKPVDRVELRRRGKLFDIISGRDMIVMDALDELHVLPLPRKRLTQNYIEGQNLLFEGTVYTILGINLENGRINARKAIAGKNDEVYQYIQDRYYRAVLNDDAVEYEMPAKFARFTPNGEGIQVEQVFVSAFRAPLEVVTKGYYEVDPHTMDLSCVDSKYQIIDKPGDDKRAKQTYRVYGGFPADERSYADESLSTYNWSREEKGAKMMLIKITGKLGADVNKTMLLASVMLTEILRTMFPSVADSVAVCPVLHGEMSDEDSATVMRTVPKFGIAGDNTLVSEGEFGLLIIEDSATELGVVSMLMTSGTSVTRLLFEPLFDYLTWYTESGTADSYLNFGLDHVPACFDFVSLLGISKTVGDDKHDIKYVDLDTIVEHDVCDFCGRKYPKGDDVFELDDGRKMCRDCGSTLVGNDKKALRAHLDRAKVFIESTYGVEIGEEYEVCFESTVKIVNTLKQNRNLVSRGSDIPLKSYVDDKKAVHVEYNIPSVSLSELLVRELTHAWQIINLQSVDEELAEGHIALVGIQYLRALSQNGIAAVRTTYYESNQNVSGNGYRKLVRALIENPQYGNNPFKYLMDAVGGGVGGGFVTKPQPIGLEDIGEDYKVSVPDRATGEPPYFYHERLGSGERAGYEAMLKAVLNHDASVSMPGLSRDEIIKISYAVRYDHPEVFWFRTVATTSDGGSADLIYGATRDESEELRRRIDEVTGKYLEGITPEMSAYDVAIRLYIKIISNVDYDSIALKEEEAAGGPSIYKIDYLRSICGVFLNGKAVCEGYARAIQYLLQKCGVECAEAAGTINGSPKNSGGHAWNIVKIDGEYYYFDVTWDDRSNTVQDVKNDSVGFTYFCITSDELRRTRDTNDCPTSMPECVSKKANYYYHNKLLLDQYRPDKVTEIAENAAKRGSKFFTVKFSTLNAYLEAFNAIIENRGCYDILKNAARYYSEVVTDPAEDEEPEVEKTGDDIPADETGEGEIPSGETDPAAGDGSSDKPAKSKFKKPKAKKNKSTKQIDTTRYTYSSDNDIYTLTIYFKFQEKK